MRTHIILLIASCLILTGCSSQETHPEVNTSTQTDCVNQIYTATGLGIRFSYDPNFYDSEQDGLIYLSGEDTLVAGGNTIKRFPNPMHQDLKTFIRTTLLSGRNTSYTLSSLGGDDNKIVLSGCQNVYDDNPEEICPLEYMSVGSRVFFTEIPGISNAVFLIDRGQSVSFLDCNGKGLEDTLEKMP